MNYYITLAFIPIIFNYADEITIDNGQQQYSPSILSIRDFVLTLNFDNAITDDRRLQSILEIYAENVQYNVTLGTMLLNGSNTFTFTRNVIDDTNIINQFDTITIKGLFVFEYYHVLNVDSIEQTLISLSASNYSSDIWTWVTQNGVNDSPYIWWNVTFQFKKSCQNQNYGFYCDNQNSTTSTSTTSTTMTTNCDEQIHDLENDRDKEKDKKSLYLWLMIGFIVLSIIFFLLMILFCCCWLRDRGRAAQYEEKPPKPMRRDRVDIVHPHSYPEEQRVERNVTVRQRTLPPYRPPQPQQQRSTQGPIDASSNIVPPRTQYSQHQQQPSRPFQYPSDDDDWSIPPNEHVV
uniref:Uncharacterized protein n=1 Tax=Panagrolaimus sp. PS1159 TaxID=55785 RepID=A0AC35FEX9_9BILA